MCKWTYSYIAHAHCPDKTLTGSAECLHNRGRTAHKMMLLISRTSPSWRSYGKRIPQNNSLVFVVIMVIVLVSMQIRYRHQKQPTQCPTFFFRRGSLKADTRCFEDFSTGLHGKQWRKGSRRTQTHKSSTNRSVWWGLEHRCMWGVH